VRNSCTTTRRDFYIHTRQPAARLLYLALCGGIRSKDWVTALDSAHMTYPLVLSWMITIPEPYQVQKALREQNAVVGGNCHPRFQETLRTHCINIAFY